MLLIIKKTLFVFLLFSLSFGQLGAALNDLFKEVVPDMLEESRNRVHQERLLELERERLEIERQRLELERSKISNNTATKYDQTINSNKYNQPPYRKVQQDIRVHVMTPIDTLDKYQVVNVLSEVYGELFSLSSIKQADITVVITIADSSSMLKKSYDNVFTLDKMVENSFKSNGEFKHLYIYGIDDNMGVELFFNERKKRTLN